MNTSVVTDTRSQKLVHLRWEEHETVQLWKTAQQVSGNTDRPHLNRSFPSGDMYPEERGGGMYAHRNSGFRAGIVLNPWLKILSPLWRGNQTQSFKRVWSVVITYCLNPTKTRNGGQGRNGLRFTLHRTDKDVS